MSDSHNKQQDTALDISNIEPVWAWSETKWYAECSKCEAKNEVPTDDCYSGARTGHTCTKCGARFIFKNDI